MLTAEERYRWHELTEQLADDEKRFERSALTADGDRGHMGSWLRMWLPLLILPIIGLAVAIAGSRGQLGIPAMGLFGVGLMIAAPLMQLWYFDHVVNRGYRPRS